MITMPRYIDADALEKIFYSMSMCSSSAYCNAFNKGVEKMFEEIQNAPTLDLVPAPVKCGECKYAKKYQKVYLMCLNPDKQCGFVNNGFYCANGKRKEQK
jgi:hypothetical protein